MTPEQRAAIKAAVDAMVAMRQAEKQADTASGDARTAKEAFETAQSALDGIPEGDFYYQRGGKMIVVRVAPGPNLIVSAPDDLETA